ncbi:MAG: cytochrome c maturation protein CcmE [Dehalococcoidales bacterium]|nr:cytochrome c maturation protein CcmE [Dehalococcoidales bacterium]
MLKQKKFLIGGLIVFLAISYLGYTAFSNAATYYYTVGEVTIQGDSIYDKNIRVNGRVAAGSVKQESAGSILRFTISDVNGEGSLPVVYQGVVPDTFKVDSEIVIEGYLDSDGVFQAHTLMPKCPSRYVPE